MGKYAALGQVQDAWDDIVLSFPSDAFGGDGVAMAYLNLVRPYYHVASDATVRHVSERARSRCE